MKILLFILSGFLATTGFSQEITLSKGDALSLTPIFPFTPGFDTKQLLIFNNTNQPLVFEMGDFTSFQDGIVELAAMTEDMHTPKHYDLLNPYLPYVNGNILPHIPIVINSQSSFRATLRFKLDTDLTTPFLVLRYFTSSNKKAAAIEEKSRKDQSWWWKIKFKEIRIWDDKIL
jgi:hypothetical protein